MVESFSQMWHEISERPDGPLAFRFYLQPLMAMYFAVRDGIRDAKAGKPAYLWSLFTDPTHWRERVREAWKSVGKLFVFAFCLDAVYQLVVLKGLRPVEGLITAIALALVPYVLLRGPANRLFRLLARRRAPAG